MKTPISFWLVVLLCCSLFKYQTPYAACPNVTPSFTVSIGELCGSDTATISLFNTSVGTNSGSTGYYWFVNGALFANTIGTGTSPTNTIIGYGSYNFMLVAYDTIGFCQDTVYQTAVLVEKPDANFGFASDTFCPNFPVIFTDSSTNTVASTTYNWTYSGGGSSAAKNPVKSFSTGGGLRTITQIVYNSSTCSDTAVKTLYISPTPPINIGGDDGSGDLTNCLSSFDTTSQELVQFFNNSDTGVVYTWDFGDGSPTVNQSFSMGPDTISHLFNSFGTFLVVCSATDSNGCTYADTLTVIFDKMISASFIVPPPQISGCTPHLVQFINNSPPHVSAIYTWDFQDGPSIVTTAYAAPPHTYDSTGSYTITLTASNACITRTASFGTIDVSSSPEMGFNHDLVGRGCSPQDITFANLSQGVSPIANFYWDMGNGNTYVGSDPPLQTYGVGEHVITLVGGNSCGFDTITDTIQIDSLPTAIFAGKDTIGCSPMVVNASAIPSGYNTLSRWYVDGIRVGFGDTLPTQTFNNFTTTIQTYTVNYSLGNHCGYFDTSFVVTVHPNAQAILNPTPNPICAGATLNHTSISTDTSLNFSWSFGDGSSSTLVGPHSKTYTNSGIDSVKLVVNGLCGSDSIVKYIRIDSMPYANATIYNSEGCSPLVVTGNSVSFGNGTTTFWVHNGLPISFVDTLIPYVFNHSGGSVLYDSIRLFINNHCGSYDTAFDIIIHPEVNAVINPSNSLICEGDSITFSSLSSGDSISYLWKFGNGDTSTQIGPHVRHFSSGGFDTTWLIVDGYCGVDSISSISSTNPYPVADIINDLDSGCEDLRVNFNNRAPNGANYSWSFSNAVPGSSALYNPSVLFVDSGVQQVFLAVDSLGCLSYDSIEIVVFPGPNPAFSLLPNSGCSELAVSITNNSLITNGDSYLWRFGNGDTSHRFTPSVEIFTNSSNLIDSVYDIELVIYTNNGCNDSLTQTVRVHPIPESNFGVSDTVFCEKEIVSFYDSSVGASSFKWYFGDGDSSAFSSPTHSYDTAGIYTITFITSSFWNCSDTSYDTIVVNPNPRVIFYFDTACLSFSTNFSDSTLFGPVTWNWTFGDGNTSSLQNPTNLYLKDSTYSVSLVVSNNFGCFDSASHFVDVYKKPDAGFDISAACAKISTQFTDTSDGFPNSWLWDFGDGGTSSLQNPSHIYLVGGNYNVQLIVGNAAGCSDTITNTITITAVPGTYFIADTVCLGSPTYFIDSSTLTYPVLTRLWNFGNGNSSTQTNPVYQFINAGVYSVSLSITNINGCDSTYVGSVVVLPEPSASFLYDTVCFGDSTRFTNTSSGNIQYSVWNYGDGSPLDTNSNSVTHHVYANSGAFLVNLIITNNSGCVDTVSHIVFVEAQPYASFYPINDSACLNKSTSFINTSVGGTNYFWRFGDGNTSSLTNPIHTYSSSGAYLVQLISTSSFGCIDSIVDTLNVLSNPIADFIVDTVCFNHESYFTNISIGTSLKYSWTFGDGYVDTVSNPIHLYPKDSNYQSSLVVTDVFGCTDTLLRTVTVLPKTTSNFDYSTACETRPILFSDSTIGNPISWRWNFGDGNTDTVQNPIHSYADSGVYSVTLITANAQGCFDTIVKTVVVYTIPVPDFFVDTVCFGNTASFINLSTFSQPITSYSWDFGDGNSSYSANPNYIYGASGLYNVTLTVTNAGGCDSSITKSIYVRPVPVADYIYDTVCAGLPTTFTDISAGSPISWSWNFGDFSPIDSSGPIVRHTYSSPGTYTTSLLVKSGSNGCTSQAVKFVTVINGVNASFNFGQPVCDGSAVQFINSSTTGSGSIATSNWAFGDGATSSMQNPIHLYGGPGVYRVTLSVASTLGCVSKDSMMLLVNPKPVVNFGYVPNICVGNPTPFYDSSTISTGIITQWRWNFGDGGVDSVKNPAHTYNNSGVFSVNLQVTSDSGCIDIGSKLVYINPESNVNFAYTSVCVGDSVQFTDLTTIGAFDTIVGWYWDFGDGNTSTLQNPKHSYATNTQSYLVRLTVTSGLGCFNDTAILISHLPVPDFNYGPEFFGYCENETIQFYDSSLITAPTNIVGWEWSFGDGYKSFSQNPTHAIDSAGSYFVKLKFTTSDGCVFNDSILSPLVIYPVPIPVFDPVPAIVSVFRPEVYFNNLTTGAISYVWDFGDGSPTVTSSYPTHTFPNIVGYYRVKLTAYSDFGCVDSTFRTIYVKDEFSLYAPNAFTPKKEFNNVFLVKGYNVSNFHLKVFNRWGELIFETTDMTEGWDGTNNGKDCQNGVYIYQIEARDTQGNDHSKTGHVTLIK